MTQAASVADTGTVILNVGLDLSKNPRVRIDVTDKHADSGDRIMWLKEPDAPEFRFVGFEPAHKEFGVPDIKDHKIECDFETSKPENSKHPYTIFVEFQNAMYHSDSRSSGGPDEGRAVIRN